MVDEARSITVTIMGREYQIACPPEEHERLTECAEYLNGRMNAIRKRGRSMGIERIAIMAALNMSHELLEAREQLGDDSGNDDRIQGLLSRLDNEIRAFEEGNDETPVKP